MAEDNKTPLSLGKVGDLGHTGNDTIPLTLAQAATGGACLPGHVYL